MKSRTTNSTVRGYLDSYRVTCSCLSEDGTQLVNVFNNRCIVFDTATHQPLFQVNSGNTHHKTRIRMVQISPNNEFLVTVGVDRQVCVWLLTSLSVTQTRAVHTVRKVNYDPLLEFIKDADTLLFSENQHEPFHLDLTSSNCLSDLPSASFLHSLTITSAHVMSMVLFESNSLQNRADAYEQVKVSNVVKYPGIMSLQTEYETISVQVPQLVETQHGVQKDIDDQDSSNDTSHAHVASNSNINNNVTTSVPSNNAIQGKILYCALGFESRVQVFDVSRAVEIGKPLLLDQSVYSQSVQRSELVPELGWCDYSKPVQQVGSGKGTLSVWDIVTHDCQYYSSTARKEDSTREESELNSEVLRGLEPTAGHSGSILCMSSVQGSAHSVTQHRLIPLIEQTSTFSSATDQTEIECTLAGIAVSNASVALLPSLLVTASVDSTVKIWRVRDFQQGRRDKFIQPIDTVCLGSTVKQVVLTANCTYFVALTFDGVIHVYNILSKQKVISINSKNTPESILVQSYTDHQVYSRVQGMLRKLSSSQPAEKVTKFVKAEIASYVCTVRVCFATTQVIIDVYDQAFLSGRHMEASAYSEVVKEYKRRRLVFPSVPISKLSGSAAQGANICHVESVEIHDQPPPPQQDPFVMQGSTLILKNFRVQTQDTSKDSSHAREPFHTDGWNPNTGVPVSSDREITVKRVVSKEPRIPRYQQPTGNRYFGTTNTCNAHLAYARLGRTAPTGVAWPKPSQLSTNLGAADSRPLGFINRYSTSRTDSTMFARSITKPQDMINRSNNLNE